MAVIMVVDDESGVVETLRNFLAELGHESIVARSGKEAIEKLREREPDLMLSDIHMSEMSGYALCSYVKEDEKTRHIPIILISGVYGSEEDVKLAHRFGAADFMGKPFSLQDLGEKIDQLLNGDPKT